MLRAILQGKAGRVGSADIQVSWRELFRQREDLLTSVFFSRIRYLSPEGTNLVMRILLGEAGSAGLDELQELVFWPKLPGDDDRRYVEPDVVMQFSHATVVVEVKPPAGGPQGLDQWKAEIAAQLRSDASETGISGDKLHFVAVGRNAPNWDEWKGKLEHEFSEAQLEVHAVEWGRIREGVSALLGNSTCRDRAIYSDWLEAFSLYGLHDAVRSFEDILQIRSGPMEHLESLFDQYFSPARTCDWTALSQFSNQSLLRISQWE